MDVEIPAYTLRGYTLQWAVTSPDGGQTFSSGNMPLPTLAPGTKWSGQVTWTIPAQDYVLTIRIVRPTGFSVTAKSYNANGELLP